MKKLIAIIIVCYLGCACISAYIGVMLGRKKEQDRVRWPEEIKALSTDPLRPDTLTGYQSKGVIHIQFK